jgi:hypothetical protein
MMETEPDLYLFVEPMKFKTYGEYGSSLTSDLAMDFVRTMDYDVTVRREVCAGPELLHLSLAAVSGMGSLTGLVALLKAYFHRNDGKSFTLRLGEDSVTVQGQDVDDKLVQRVAQALRPGLPPGS